VTVTHVPLLTADEAAAVLDECHALCALPEHDRRPRDKPHTGTHHLVDIAERSELVRELVQRRALQQAVTEIIGPSFAPMQLSYRSPQPGFGAQKLHTDGLPKLDSGPDTLATALVALVDFDIDNGATRIVPGSHRRPDLQRLGGSLDRHRDEIVLTGPVGTAFVFSGHALHSGTKNRSSKERPALQLQWRAT